MNRRRKRGCDIDAENTFEAEAFQYYNKSDPSWIQKGDAGIMGE